MCILIYKAADKEIPKETLQQCWKINDDGAGFMYNHEDRLRVKKGFFDFDKFYDSYSQSTAGKKAVIHFRIKTHGAIDMQNCHPFRVTDSLAFAHNGIISNIKTPNKDKSDTWHFNENVLKPLANITTDFFGNSAITELLRGYIGSSKLVFLDKENTVYILNEHMGEWHDGCWYSNSSYKIPKITHFPATNHRPYKDQKALPFIKKGNALLKEGTLVELTANYNGLSFGDIAEIKSVNSDYTVNLEVYDKNSDQVYYKYQVPFAYVDVIETTNWLEWYENNGN